MEIKSYITKLLEKSNEISIKSISEYHNELSDSHFKYGLLYDFIEEIINSNEEPCALKNAISQLETSIYCLSLGLYRQAYSSLRLGFELALGSIQFSVNKLDFLEWQIGKQDVKWSKIIDEENGVLSKRFFDVFFPELTTVVEYYNSSAKNSYRKLSEFVHGNNETWKKDGLELTYNSNLAKNYFSHYKSISEILLICLSMRYLKHLERGNLDFILTELSHIEGIRLYLGGPK